MNNEHSIKFKLPIEYIPSAQLHLIKENILDDLELLKNKPVYDSIDTEKDCDTSIKDPSTSTIINYLFNPSSTMEKSYVNMHTKYTTTCLSYLKNTQQLLLGIKDEQINEIKQKEERTKVYDSAYLTWSNIKNDEEFLEKYYFIDIDYFKFLNNSSMFLQLLSVYNLLSPLLSFLLPVILLIIPFFIIKFNGIEVSFTNYISLVTNTLSKHPLGNIFKIFDAVPIETKIYSIISILFYVFSMYQNTLVCYRFYKNFQYIHEVLFSLRDYLFVTIENMTMMENLILKQTTNTTYDKFACSVGDYKTLCESLHKMLIGIEPLHLSSSALIKKSYEIGKIMKLFHDVHLNAEVIETMEYSFGFNCYFENLCTLSKHVENGELNEGNLASEKLFLRENEFSNYEYSK